MGTFLDLALHLKEPILCSGRGLVIQTLSSDQERPSLRMAACGDSDSRGQGHGFETTPFPPDPRASPRDPAIDLYPAGPSHAWGYSVSAGYPDFRLLLNDIAFQALTQENVGRLHPDCDVPPGGEGDLISLPFPRKLWRLVNSSQFSSIWWDDDGTCIGINESLFQKEILDRTSPNKVFESGRMKSFFRQLQLYGFSRKHPRHPSLSFTNSSTAKRPDKIQFFHNPYFQRDSPHLLVRLKRRVAQKSTSKPVGSKPEVAESHLASVAMEQQDDCTSPNEDSQEIPKNQVHHGRAAQLRSASAPPVVPMTAPGPTVMNGEAPVIQPSGGQPECSQAHGTLRADVRAPEDHLFVCFTLPPTQIPSNEPMADHPAMPPGVLPFCHPWMPVSVMAAGPAGLFAMIPHAPPLFHRCPNCHWVSEFTPATAGPQASPDCSAHST
ncbi:heat shock transcription factor, X-linked-like [Carlito syrichta]|uniref:Heat shock transcription factor, X-linked-like n=1 Tax=Carlito syrichta TaxID=1868482 RepID=A0A1U7TZV6_CARSF|nr:heat shock transcription factor, X-linked-like [Carlito syrichta]